MEEKKKKKKKEKAADSADEGGKSKKKEKKKKTKKPKPDDNSEDNPPKNAKRETTKLDEPDLPDDKNDEAPPKTARTERSGKKSVRPEDQDEIQSEKPPISAKSKKSKKGKDEDEAGTADDIQNASEPADRDINDEDDNDERDGNNAQYEDDDDDDDESDAETRAETRAKTGAASKATRRNLASPSLFEIEVYKQDDELSNNEYFEKFGSEELRLLQELKTWQDRHDIRPGSKEMSEAVDTILTKGIDWEEMLKDDHEMAHEDKQEIEDKMKEISELTTAELLEIVGDPYL